MRRLASLVLASLALLPPLLLYGGPAAAQGADAQGWWWIAHRAGAPAPPAPPDVAADDLLLQGGDVQRELDRTGTPAPTAVAALRFVVPSGAVVGRLVLPVAAGAQAAAVNAYRAAGSWTPAQAGALGDAPAPDLSSVATGALSPDGTSLVFTGVDRLVADDGVLSLVLVAGPLDRVVVHHPPGHRPRGDAGPPARAPAVRACAARRGRAGAGAGAARRAAPRGQRPGPRVPGPGARPCRRSHGEPTPGGEAGRCR